MTTVLWSDATRDEVSRVARSAIAVLPIASTEQHGAHLATTTDTVVLNAVVQRACDLVDSKVDVLLAPTLVYGSSDHHLPFGGTLSLRSATLGAVLADLLRSIARAGCSRILVLNGHGGNASICRVAASDASIEEGVTIATTSYWELVDAPKDSARFPGHAGKFETSLMLAVRPDLVRLELARASKGKVPARRAGLDLYPANFWQSIDGFMDDPRAASQAIGEELLSECAKAVALTISEMALG